VDPERARERLESERERLRSILESASRLVEEDVESTRGELSHADQHPAEEATEVVEEELDLAIRQRLEHELAEVDAALDRLHRGTYGICEVCGRPIGDERLEALPTARLCLEDQQRAERELAPR
jgi:RNA polymerase-binding protein DksA